MICMKWVCFSSVCAARRHLAVTQSWDWDLIGLLVDLNGFDWPTRVNRVGFYVAEISS